jgi:DNA-binding transcriptional MerR regulator
MGLMAGFDDGKDAGALRTIGEVSEALGIKPHILRYWEQQFPLLKPLKRSGGRRYYRAADVAMVEAIDRLINREGYTLKGAEAVLRASGKKPAPQAGDVADPSGVRLVITEEADLSDVIAGLKAVRAKLARALEA